MKLRLLSAACLLMLCSSVQAQFLGIGKNKHKTPYDSHVVVQGETVYGISRSYHTTVDELLAINPAIKNKAVSIGETINVPFISRKDRRKDKEREKMLQDAIVYTVQKKETLYSIAKRNNTNVATLRQWNDLADETVQEGQQLIVGFKNEALKKMNDVAAETESKVEDEEGDVPKNESSDPARPMVTQKGAALWIRSVDDNGGLYALHPTAPIGSEITVKNLMNNRTVSVKVIGKLPATSENHNILIKLSSSAAKQLGVLDAKFQVELQYPQAH
ncbi:MAG: LysM peptidoglycan-binding domain-containing protein [Chitinophagales bacterium]|nr:LysM peptidoglycan-binding domain-containing protein [Chitinophagales bacterium]